MQATDKLDKLLTRVEPVEWCYDGLGGKIIDWTMDHGSKKRDGKPQDHPSLLAFIVGRDGKPFALLSDGRQYQAGSLVKWAEEQLDAYERQFPSTRLAFLRSKVAVRGKGDDAKAVCAAFTEARDAKQPVALYFGRAHAPADDKALRKEVKRARKFEKGVLNSKTAEKQATGWTLLRFDLSDETHALFAKAHGVTTAPSILVFLPGADKPTVLDHKATGHALARHLKTGKLAAKK